MDFLNKFLKRMAPHFEKGGRLEFFHPVFDMVDTIAFTPSAVTKGSCHVRDGLEQKRLMIIVVFALLFPLLFGVHNIGHQVSFMLKNTALELKHLAGWRMEVMNMLGLQIGSFSILSNFVYGLLYFLPIFLVTIAVGGICEVLFALFRRHEIAEAFLVTSFLIPLTMPPNVPLWQVALATAFGVVIGKEIFGGVGFNLFNPALLARAFLFFSYPASMSGNSVWIAVDGITVPTPLAVAAENGLWGARGLVKLGYSIKDSFWGLIPGSIGEVSTFACLLGMAVLLFTGVASWRVMLSLIVGFVVTVLGFNFFQSSSVNPMFELTPEWHFVLGGLAFGLVYMATDPVTSAMTFLGQFVYGFLIGFLVILIRVVNPAYPEGMMLAILFMNMLAPLIDYLVVQSNIKRRERRYGRSQIV